MLHMLASGWAEFKGFVSLKCDPSAEAEEDSGMLNLRALIHGNNTTVAACATTMQGKSVVTALPGRVSHLLYGTFEVSLVEHYL